MAQCQMSDIEAGTGDITAHKKSTHTHTQLEITGVRQQCLGEKENGGGGKASNVDGITQGKR